MAESYALIRVRLTPRAGRDAIGPGQGNFLHVRVAAPPADNQANDAMVRLVAKALSVAPSRVTLIAGARGRFKTLSVEGMTDDEVWERLNAQAAERTS